MNVCALTYRPVFWHRILWLVLCLFVISQTEVRAQRRQTDQKVYLDHADQLYYDQYKRPNVQIVKGNVSFRHAGTHLRCDSAYFNERENTFEAFGHVRMNQSDTLTLTSDYAWYDGRPEREMVYARKNVVVTHRKTSVLKTDSLNYDRKFNYVFYAEGGHFHDSKKNVDMVSDWGRYNLDTREAVAYYNVTLKSPDYEIRTDTLYYDAAKERAQVMSRSTIYSNKDGYQITSSNGYYYMKGDRTEMFDRSTIENGQRSIVGDSLYYDSDTKTSRGYGDVVYIDKKNKNELRAGTFIYNELTGAGQATRRPVFIDYSQKDTLYLHADTMRVQTFYINTDSVYREIYCYNKVRAYRKDLQAMCDSLVICSRDSSLTMFIDPILWNGDRQLVGDEIRVLMNDSIVREAHASGKTMSVELMYDGKHFNQIASKFMHSFFDDKGILRRNVAEGNVMVVYFPYDDKDSTLIGLNYTETDTMRMYISERRQLEKIWMPKAEGVLYPMGQIPPGEERLPGFAWYDDLRPINKDDIFVWRGKEDHKEKAN